VLLILTRPFDSSRLQRLELVNEVANLFVSTAVLGISTSTTGLQLQHTGLFLNYMIILLVLFNLVYIVYYSTENFKILFEHWLVFWKKTNKKREKTKKELRDERDARKLEAYKQKKREEALEAIGNEKWDTIPSNNPKVDNKLTDVQKIEQSLSTITSTNKNIRNRLVIGKKQLTLIKEMGSAEDVEEDFMDEILLEEQIRKAKLVKNKTPL